jgi:hypothetical protein
VKNAPLNIYFEDPNQFAIKTNSETCSIEIERIHVGRNGVAEEFSIFQLNINGVKRHQKFDTQLQPEKSHNKENILCNTVAPYEESFRILKYALGVAKYNEMSGIIKINRGTLSVCK